MLVILLLAVFALAGVFAVDNEGTQVFRFLDHSWTLPTWAPTAIALGAVSPLFIVVTSYGRLGSRLRNIGLKREIDENRRVIKRLRAENLRLREELAAARGEAPPGRRQAGGAVPGRK